MIHDESEEVELTPHQRYMRRGGLGYDVYSGQPRLEYVLWLEAEVSRLEAELRVFGSGDRGHPDP